MDEKGLQGILEKMEMKRMKNTIQWKEWLYKRVQIETASENKLISKMNGKQFKKRTYFHLKWSETILFLFEYEHMNNYFF